MAGSVHLRNTFAGTLVTAQLSCSPDRDCSRSVQTYAHAQIRVLICCAVHTASLRAVGRARNVACCLVIIILCCEDILLCLLAPPRCWTLRLVGFHACSIDDLDLSVFRSPTATPRPPIPRPAFHHQVPGERRSDLRRRPVRLPLVYMHLEARLRAARLYPHGDHSSSAGHDSSSAGHNAPRLDSNNTHIASSDHD